MDWKRDNAFACKAKHDADDGVALDLLYAMPNEARQEIRNGGVALLDRADHGVNSNAVDTALRKASRIALRHEVGGGCIAVSLCSWARPLVSSLLPAIRE